MKIDTSRAVRTAVVRHGKKGRDAHGSDSFESHIASGAPAAGATGAPGLTVNPILSAQEVDGLPSEAIRDRARGDAILDHLEEVRMGLLLGFISKSKVEDLKRLVRDRPGRAADRRLIDILDQIELRAEVELAKLSLKS